MSNGDGKPRGNEEVPIRDSGQLSPPIVREPIHECARAVHIEGFVPHALVVVLANDVEVVGQSSPYLGYDDISLIRTLVVGDRITATQQAFGFTSDQSYHPVTVDHQPVSLGKPTLSPVLYACGQVVSVGGLSPSTDVEVYSAPTSPVPILPGNLIGEAECTGSWKSVVTEPLTQGWFVSARQVSCRRTNHEIASPESASLVVPPEPHPVKPPVLARPVVSNDVADLDKLYVGADVSVTDVTLNVGVGGGLANANRDLVPVQPPVQAHKYSAAQNLCTASPPAEPVDATTQLLAPVLLSPICSDDRTVTIQRTIINATVALFRVGVEKSVVIGIGGAVLGDLELAIGSAFTLNINDVLYVRQFMGSTISPSSNQVTVVNCRNVVTQHNDIRRTGAYLHEHVLTPANVGSATFGRLCEREVDGSPYAQILYVRDVSNIGNGSKNLFIVATSTNIVYAFDADDHTPGGSAGLVWKTELGPTRMLNSGEICRETFGTVGVTSTPVVDVTAQTVYVVARHWPGDTRPTPPGNSRLDGDNYVHALYLNDGSDRVPPRKIEGTDPRTGNTFDPQYQRNRPGLLLLNGILYVGFGVFNCDQGPYHGWVFGYQAEKLEAAAIFCTTMELRGGGVWQSGNGLVGADDGSIYFETGNEIGDGQPPPTNFGDCFLRLSVIADWPGLVQVGFFRPADWKVLRDGDTDLGAGGPALLPGGLLIGGGKQGRYYVLDAQSMQLTQDATSPDFLRVGEGFQAFFNRDRDVTADAADNFAVYATGEAPGPNIHGGPCYWRGPSYIYQMSEKDFLKAFHYDRSAGIVHQAPVRVATVRPGPGMPGGHSSLSANGDEDGIVWTCVPVNDGQWAPTQGHLVAFDALTLKEIWIDLMPEWFAKFNPPTIGDGKVFRPVFAQYQLPNPDNGAAPSVIRSGKVIIYGLLPRSSPNPGQPSQWRRWSGGGESAPRFTIEQRVQAHGGSGALVAPVGEQVQLGDQRGGQRRDFTGWVTAPRGRVSVRAQDPDASCDRPPRHSVPVSASIYWSPETGAHVVLGDIRDEYIRIGAQGSNLGYPVSDERDTTDGTGRISYFEHGSIVWHSVVGVEIRLHSF